MLFGRDLCLGKRRRSSACRHACPHLCLYFWGGGLGGKRFGVFFPNAHQVIEIYLQRSIFSLYFEGSGLFGSLANRDDCSEVLHGPILFSWILVNNNCDPMWKVLIFQLQFLLYFQTGLSLGLGRENWGNYGFSSFTLFFWWLENVILNWRWERARSLWVV